MASQGLCEGDTYDLLVIGGGIVGSGVARDAALRGLKTLLVDKGDFATGTSSRSSRLLHGGIRYLAQARIGLVREASREKTVLHRIAPHLAEPLAFVFPARRSSQWSLWKLTLGVKVYDLLCGLKNLGSSERLSRAKTLQMLPGLEPDGLTGAVRYFDGFTNDARLVLDTLRSAATGGATVSNYVRFVGAEVEDSHWLCQLEPQGQTPLTINAKAVVNATGPWSGELPHSQATLRLTKGVHLVIDRAKLPLDDAVVMSEGNRILFAIPWGEKLILGTTDTDYDGDINHPQCSRDDARYVLAATNEAFPTAKLTEADVRAAWAGLRPLVAQPGGKPSDISRRHEIVTSHPGWWDVTGGKLTTYRLMAEETVDDIVQHFAFDASSCQTDTEPLVADAAQLRWSSTLPPPVSRDAVEHFCRHEWAVHLADVMIRRTSWRYYLPNEQQIAEQVCEWMAEFLDWSDERQRTELEKYRAIVDIVD